MTGTLRPAAMALRFLFLADPQLGCYAALSGLSDPEIADMAGQGLVVRRQPLTTGWAWEVARLRAALELGLTLSPDVVVLGGDMVHDVSDDSQVADLLGLTDEVPDGIALHLVPGNHDVAPDAVTPTPESLERYRDLFGPEEVAFAHAEVSFVVLNTSLLARRDRLADAADAHLEEVDAALAAAATRAGPTVVLGHHPSTSTTPTSRTGTGRWPGRPAPGSSNCWSSTTPTWSFRGTSTATTRSTTAPSRW